MDHIELLKNYELLLGENRRLIKENDWLKAQLGIADNNPLKIELPNQPQRKAYLMITLRTMPCFQV
jgi:hypothetical protein